MICNSLGNFKRASHPPAKARRLSKSGVSPSSRTAIAPTPPDYKYIICKTLLFGMDSAIKSLR